MNNKKYFLITGFLALLILGACAPQGQVVAPVAGGTNQPAPSISVSGSGQVNVTPDIAYINVGVRSEGDTVSEALELNNQQAHAIKDTLMEEGVAEEDIQTSSFNVYPQSEYDFQGQPTRDFFSVENVVYVTVRNLDNLGQILDAVARSGANNIYGINFDVQDKTEAQAAARELAVESAQRQAQELADAAGVELGGLISISTSQSVPSPYYGYAYGMGGGGDGSVPVASGQMQINAQVTLVYAIQ